MGQIIHRDTSSSADAMSSTIDFYSQQTVVVTQATYFRSNARVEVLSYI